MQTEKLKLSINNENEIGIKLMKPRELIYDKVNDINIHIDENIDRNVYFAKAKLKTDGRLQSLHGRILLNFKNEKALYKEADRVYKAEVMIDFSDTNKFIYFDNLTDSMDGAEFFIKAFPVEVIVNQSRLSIPCKTLVNSTILRNADKIKAGVFLKIAIEFCYNQGFILQRIDVYDTHY